MWQHIQLRAKQLATVWCINMSAASDRQVGGSHYKDMGVQTWDVVDTWPREQQIGYYRGGALKYIMRMGTKDQNLQEIQKGQHYLEKLIEILQSDLEEHDPDQETLSPAFDHMKIQLLNEKKSSFNKYQTLNEAIAAYMKEQV